MDKLIYGQTDIWANIITKRKIRINQKRSSRLGNDLSTEALLLIFIILSAI